MVVLGFQRVYGRRMRAGARVRIVWAAKLRASSQRPACTPPGRGCPGTPSMTRPWTASGGTPRGTTPSTTSTTRSTCKWRTSCGWVLLLVRQQVRRRLLCCMGRADASVASCIVGRLALQPVLLHGAQLVGELWVRSLPTHPAPCPRDAASGRDRGGAKPGHRGGAQRGDPVCLDGRTNAWPCSICHTHTTALLV